VARVAYLANPDNAGTLDVLAELKLAAAAAGMVLIGVEFGSATDFDCRRPHILRRESARPGPARRGLRAPHSAGRQARRTIRFFAKKSMIRQIVSSRVSAKQDGTRFAALADGRPRFGDTDGKAPSHPKHREIENDEGHETGIRSRMAFDQQPDTDRDGLTNQHACEEYKQ
jgi:hypothetical protein